MYNKHFCWWLLHNFTTKFLLTYFSQCNCRTLKLHDATACRVLQCIENCTMATKCLTQFQLHHTYFNQVNLLEWKYLQKWYLLKFCKIKHNINNYVLVMNGKSAHSEKSKVSFLSNEGINQWIKIVYPEQLSTFKIQKDGFIWKN